MLNVLDQHVRQLFKRIRPQCSHSFCVVIEDLQKRFTIDLALSNIFFTLASLCTMWTTSCNVCTTHGVRSTSIFWYRRSSISVSASESLSVMWESSSVELGGSSAAAVVCLNAATILLPLSVITVRIFLFGMSHSCKHLSTHDFIDCAVCGWATCSRANNMCSGLCCSTQK